MPRKLVFLHTVSSLITLFEQLASEILPPDIETVHIADEMLLKVVLDEGGLSPFLYSRVASHVAAAEQYGADAVMLTCSSISPCADVAQLMVTIPVLKIGEAMVDKAISMGNRIGVAATAVTTLQPTTELVHTRACLLGKEVEVESMLCEGAYNALFAGDTDTHDRIVRDTLKALMSRNDIVVLAQASMARVADSIPEQACAVPILSSPRLALERARDIIGAMTN